MRHLLLSALFLCAASAQSDPTDKIVPAYTVAPSVFQIGQTTNVLLSLTNQNPNAVQQLQPGDVFTFTLAIPTGAFTAVSLSAVVNSSSFQQVSFYTSMGPNPNQVQITYLGPSVPFPVGDTIGVVTSVISSQVGAGAVTLQVPADRYTAAASLPLNISAVDFPIASPGPPGPTGPFGPSGPQGTAGPQGPQGPLGPEGAGLTFQNAWNVAVSYKIADAVFYNGSSYISISGNNAGVTPSNTFPWALLAQQGSPGAMGVLGLTGPAGTAGSAGPAGQVGPTGSTGSAGATGLTGATGSVGPTGAMGPAGTGTAGERGATGTAGAAGAPGNQGIQGATGASGGAVTLFAGYYSALVPGTWYASFFNYGSTNEALVFAQGPNRQPFLSPVACTLGSFGVNTGGAIPGTVTVTYYLRTSSTVYPADLPSANMVDSGSVFCTISPGTSSCNAGAATQSIVIGEVIEIKVVASGTGSYFGFFYPRYTCT